MTAAEWNSSTDPDAMLAAAGHLVSERKLFHFGCAAARRTADLLPGFVTTLIPRVEVAADAATAEEGREQLLAALDATGSSLARMFVTVRAVGSPVDVVRTAASLLRWREEQGPDGSLLATFGRLWSHNPLAARPSPQQAGLLRCVAGYPFEPPAFDPAWRTSDVVALARGAYDEKAFDRLPVLADALQDAGCDAEVLLAHLRGGGPHARGCWPVDLVLGKA